LKSQKKGGAMPQEGFKYKSTSIFSADVVGYGRLMEGDEEATVRTLKSNSMAVDSQATTYSNLLEEGKKEDKMDIFESSPFDHILSECILFNKKRDVM
jgi:hypothetical protein